MNRQARRQAAREVERLVRIDAFAKTLTEEKKKQVADEVMRRLQGASEVRDVIGPRLA